MRSSSEILDANETQRGKDREGTEAAIGSDFCIYFKVCYGYLGSGTWICIKVFKKHT